LFDNAAAFFEKHVAHRGLLRQWIRMCDLYDPEKYRALWRNHLGPIVDGATKIRRI